MDAFTDTLTRHGLSLEREEPRTLQVNVGLLCNQACRHCHLEAGPGRHEVMGRRTMEDVISFARRSHFPVIDVTGGSPELVPGIEYLVSALAPLSDRLLFRCNLTALAERGAAALVALWRANRVDIVASLPAGNEAQTDAQRGRGTWAKSLESLRILNAAGYGQEGTGLLLDLVANPAGAFLPPPQRDAEARFKRELSGRWDIAFNRLFVFANMPLGRFRAWLAASGNLDPYVAALAARFNPCTLPGLMCRTLVNVGWDGILYDCDFNQAAGLPLSGRPTHVSEWAEAPGPDSAIAKGDHCYACTAGAGFT